MRTVFIKGLIACCLIALFFNGNAQSLERQVTASAGSVLNVSDLEISCTVGEAVVTPFTTSNILLTQGFQQPYFVVIAGNNLFPWVVLYPNPTEGNAIARFVLNAPSRITITVTNSLGQEMMKESVNYTSGEMQYILPASKLRPGVYYISFRLGDGKPVVTKKLLRLDN